MPSWQKEVLLSEAKEGNSYFVAKKIGTEYYYLSRTKQDRRNGTNSWSVKPGIAMHCIFNEKVRSALLADDGLVLLEIPNDHATRWKARR